MQLMLVLGVVFAIGAVVFALQNNTAVAVTLAAWQFEGSLALVLLLALGLGVVITGLLSSPAVIRSQWAAARMRRQNAELERKVADLEARNRELGADLARLAGKAAETTSANAQPAGVAKDR